MITSPSPSQHSHAQPPSSPDLRHPRNLPENDGLQEEAAFETGSFRWPPTLSRSARIFSIANKLDPATIQKARQIARSCNHQEVTLVHLHRALHADQNPSDAFDAMNDPTPAARSLPPAPGPTLQDAAAELATASAALDRVQGILRDHAHQLRPELLIHSLDRAKTILAHVHGSIEYALTKP